MPSAAAVRRDVEVALSARLPASLTPRERVLLERTPCGVDAVDALLGGGLAAGVITELVGAQGSGRTTAALAYMAAVTRAGGVCAWIDVADALDPESAAASGIDLERLLWVRCGKARADEHRVVAEPVLRLSEPVSAGRQTGGGSPHPRTEGNDMPDAITAMLKAHGGFHAQQVRRERSRVVGTPGAPNRRLSAALADGAPRYREEQPNSDRLPPRRGDNLALTPRCAEPQERRPPVHFERKREPAAKPWHAMDQALRATDLLLQGGGFAAIVLDLGSTPPEFAWRIPLATWFRFRAGCARTRASLLLLTQHACARSSAEVVVRLQQGAFEADQTVVTGLRFEAEVARNRSANDARVVSIRKPPQAERAGIWRGEAVWARSK